VFFWTVKLIVMFHTVELYLTDLFYLITVVNEYQEFWLSESRTADSVFVIAGRPLPAPCSYM
jgi:hypothetical protein